MNFTEQVVHEFLTRDQDLFVQPDLKVTHDKDNRPWYQQIDFLALSVREKRIYLVEVTAAKAFPGHLPNKLKDREIIEAFVREDKALKELGVCDCLVVHCEKGAL